MIRAAGIMFITPDNRVLFLKRGPGGDHPGEWCFPGGKQEGDETLEACAVREAVEEIGAMPQGAVPLEWTRQVRETLPIEAAAPVPVADGTAVPAEVLPGAAQAGETVDFTTFIGRVKAEFAVTIDGEHVGWAWAPATQPPEPLHPGARVALSRLDMDDLGIARAMAAGDLASPVQFSNVTLFNLRITGTGTAYRHGLKEYVWRDPSLYLNDEFLARCNGLPVIWEHPKSKASKGVLNSDEFKQRSIGTILLPYIKGDEVWGIAKVYDDAAIALMRKSQLSTSPAVGWKGSEGTTLELDDGEKLLLERKPILVDHLAVCLQGVWDKGGPPEGVDRTAADSAPRVPWEKAERALAMVNRMKLDAAARIAGRTSTNF